MRYWLAILLMLATPAAANAARPIVTDSRIKTFVYNANEVFSLTTHYGYQANVEFGEKEEIETLSVGDRVGWQIVPAGRRLFIRAMEENAHTNMTVVTNLRAYQFDLRSSSSDAVFGSEELTYVVRFYYPEEGETAPAPIIYANQVAAPVQRFGQPYAAAPTYPVQAYNAPAPVSYAPQPYSQAYAPQPYAAPVNPYGQPVAPVSYAPQQAAQPFSAAPQARQPNPPYTPAPINHARVSPNTQPVAAAPVSPLQPIATPRPTASGRPNPSASINYKYTYSGGGNFAPVKIFDDGQSTYFKFRKGAALPKFSIITRRGEEIEVPHTINADGLAVISILSPRFSLRQGAEQVIVYNEAQPS